MVINYSLPLHDYLPKAKSYAYHDICVSRVLRVSLRLVKVCVSIKR
jgi:hypothetical protein